MINQDAYADPNRATRNGKQFKDNEITEDKRSQESPLKECPLTQSKSYSEREDSHLAFSEILEK